MIVNFVKWKSWQKYLLIAQSYFHPSPLTSVWVVLKVQIRYHFEGSWQISIQVAVQFSPQCANCSIFQSWKLLCFAVLECSEWPFLIYNGIKCSLCITKQQGPLKLTLVKDCWLDKSIATSKATAIHSVSWKFSTPDLLQQGL